MNPGGHIGIDQMNRTKSRAAVGLLAAAVATAFLPASATGWKTWDGLDETAPRAILTDSSEQAGAVLVCDPNGKMSAILSLEAGSISEQLDKHATYRRGETASISAGDTSAIETVVQYAPANRTIEIQSHSPAARIYNSVIRGEPVNVSVEHAGEVQTTYPKPDATFKAFAKTCSAARAAGGK